MIIECPNCTRRYLLEDHLFARRQSRDLRCAACDHYWTVAPDAKDSEAYQTAAQETVSSPPFASEGAPLPTSEEDFFEQRRKRLLSADAASIVEKSRRPLALGWIVYFACLLVLSGALYLARDFLVRMWPPLYRFYEIFSISLNNETTAQLHLENLGAHFVSEGTHHKAVISGAIVNQSHHAILLPPLKVTVFSPCEKGTCASQPLLFHVTTQRLLGGEKVYFETPGLPLPAPGSKAVLEF